MLYTSAETEESRIAVANAWASRRGSQPTVVRGQSDREKIALDITILKKQYDKLRERQKQAHIILTSAVSKQHQQPSAGSSHVNKLLVGKNAIISKGRKGPPKGAIPPVRNQKLVKSSKAPPKPVETLHWNNTDEAKKRRNSMTWKELNADRRTEEVKTMSKSSSASSLTGSASASKINDQASPKRRSDSSSYSEDSDCESSPSTSLCDDDITSSLEASPMKKKRHKDLPLDKSPNMRTIEETSPIASEAKDCPEISVCCSEGDAKASSPNTANFYLDLPKSLEGGDITSISQLSPMPDISSYFTAISPIRTPCDFFEFPDFSSFIMSTTAEEDKYQVNDDGVTNEFFERVFEENLAFAPASPDDANRIMSKSFSPSILKSYDEGLNQLRDEIRDLSKYIKQKSLSMDEQTRDKEEVVPINRSYSDGTIINADVKTEDLMRIIAENKKILNQLIPRAFESPDVELAKLVITVDESKSPANLSDVEEEIAAIDKADEVDEVREGILLSDIQDLANIDAYLSERRHHTASLSCNTLAEDENVTERNEKSISERNEEALATLACSPLENNVETEALTVSDEAPAKAEVVKCESPKFNEIQRMVTKLKEEMESQLKCDEIAQPKAVEKASESAVTIVISNADETAVKVMEKCAAEPMKAVIEELKTVIVPKDDSESNKSGDLEKTANESSQKIDKSDSDMILEKLNTQLEKCQKPPASPCVELEKGKSTTDGEIKKVEAVNLEGKYENGPKVVKDDCKCFGESRKSFVSESVVSESSVGKVEAKKDSKEILEKLNMQLQRYEETKKSSDEFTKPTTYETSAVMELAVMIKERELEKLSEQKQLMKSSKDVVDFELSVSPVRTRPKSNVGSPEATAKFNNYFYDHEPRSEVRRRDIITLETEQRIRRPFKSSPTSSLSSSPSNIHNTLSSIQNTIKILDSACSKTDAPSYSKLEKAMDTVDKMCDTDKDWMYYKKSSNKYEPSPTFKIDDFESHQSKRQTRLIDETKSYDLSPRHKRYDDDIGFKSPSKDPSPSRFVRTPEIDPDYVAKLRYLSTEDYIAGRKSPLSGSREMLDVKFKIDRSPTSPVLSKSTHFSRSPTRSPSYNSSLLRFPSDNRSSKSAENSPSRYSGERVDTSSCKYSATIGSIDSKAESMSNLSYKASRKCEYDWEKPSSSRKYDFY